MSGASLPGFLGDAVTTTAITDAADDVLLVAELAAVRLSSIHDRKITDVMIRKWASRGRVQRRGRRGHAILFSMEELEDYAELLYGSA